MRPADWAITLEASPVRPDMPLSDDERVVGSSVEGLAPLDDARPLRRSLKQKVSHYGELDAPYVIAALYVGTFVDDHDIEKALLGDTLYAYDRRDGRLKGARKPNGFWRGPSGPVNTRVSAVVTFPQLSPASAALVEPTVWINPCAERPLLLDFPWRRREIAPDGQVTTHEARISVAEILRLPPNWPDRSPVHDVPQERQQRRARRSG